MIKQHWCAGGGAEDSRRLQLGRMQNPQARNVRISDPFIYFSFADLIRRTRWRFLQIKRQISEAIMQ